MGEVFAAVDERNGTEVAIKSLRADLLEVREVVARFARESQAASRLFGPHVVRIFAVGEDEGVPFIVMERLVGEDLDTLLTRRGRLPIAEAARYLLAACEAVAEAHAAGIVHRDLKPANLFLSADGVVKVVDFGISKLVVEGEAAITRVDGIVGTPQYMSPEQLAASKNVEAKSDVWSLGVTLYELAVGERPFEGGTMSELIGAIFLGRFTVPSGHHGAFAPLDTVVTRALQVELAERASLPEFVELLKPLTTLPAAVSDPPALASEFPNKPRASLAVPTAPTRLDLSRDDAPAAPRDAAQEPAQPPRRGRAPVAAAAPDFRPKGGRQRPWWPFAVGAAAFVALVAGGYFATQAVAERRTVAAAARLGFSLRGAIATRGNGVTIAQPELAPLGVTAVTIHPDLLEISGDDGQPLTLPRAAIDVDGDAKSLATTLDTWRATYGAVWGSQKQGLTGDGHLIWRGLFPGEPTSRLEVGAFHLAPETKADSGCPALVGTVERVYVASAGPLPQGPWSGAFRLPLCTAEKATLTLARDGGSEKATLTFDGTGPVFALTDRP
jgi:serine/threonine-protein kinase